MPFLSNIERCEGSRLGCGYSKRAAGGKLDKRRWGGERGLESPGVDFRFLGHWIKFPATRALHDHTSVQTADFVLLKNRFSPSFASRTLPNLSSFPATIR